MEREIICVVDPMCSWCWGFSPAIDAMAEAYAGKAELSFVAGGLRPLTTEPMSDDMKADIRGHWEHVSEASGQPFDFQFFDRDGFVYDTEPPCRALVTVRELQPDAVRPFLAAAHRAFYAEGRDVTETGVLTGIAVDAGVDGDAFAETFPSREMIYRTGADFQRSAAMGVRGFPTVVLRAGETLSVLVAGFTRFENLKPKLDEWIADGLDEAEA